MQKLAGLLSPCILILAGLSSQSLAADAPASAVILPAETPIRLETTADLSSKTSSKGDQVELRVVVDVLLDGLVMIPKGTRAVGRIGFAQDTGAFGQSGKLQIEPLYLQFEEKFIRLKGGLFEKGTVTAPAAVGLLAITPGMTGRSAKMPAGTPVPAMLLRETVVEIGRKTPRP